MARDAEGNHDTTGHSGSVLCGQPGGDSMPVTRGIGRALLMTLIRLRRWA
jgi:hypothetical protein